MAKEGETTLDPPMDTLVRYNNWLLIIAHVQQWGIQGGRCFLLALGLELAGFHGQQMMEPHPFVK